MKRLLDAIECAQGRNEHSARQVREPAYHVFQLFMFADNTSYHTEEAWILTRDSARTCPTELEAENKVYRLGGQRGITAL